MTRRFLIVLTLLPFITVAAFAYTMPIFPAMICPECFNFEKFNNNIYIGKQASESQRNALTQAHATARQRLETVYGPLHADPMILSSISENQYASVGGSKKSRGETIASLVIRLSPEGLSPEVISREICHVELNMRLNKDGKSKLVPAWFSKGLALLLSQDQRFIGEPEPNDLSEQEVKKLKYPQQWNLAEKAGKQIHAPAYRIVSLWYDKAGKKGLHELINRISKGETFDRVYSELGDRP